MPAARAPGDGAFADPLDAVLRQRMSGDDEDRISGLETEVPPVPLTQADQAARDRCDRAASHLVVLVLDDVAVPDELAGVRTEPGTRVTCSGYAMTVSLKPVSHGSGGLGEPTTSTLRSPRPQRCPGG